MDTSQSSVEIHDCSAKLPYILEWAPGCDKFRQFERLEYICDKPGCGNEICAPQDQTNNCPHALNFTGACCSGQTRDGLSACYQVEDAKRSNSAWDFYWWELKDTKPNLADPFVSQVTHEFWKRIVPKQNGFYLTSYLCQLSWTNWKHKGRGQLNIEHCKRWKKTVRSGMPTYAWNELKASWDKNKIGCRSVGGTLHQPTYNKPGTCKVDMLVIYNSNTERLELLENWGRIATGYISQYAKESKEFTTHLCPSYSRKSEIDQDEAKCPVHGRCCSGQTAELVPACYEVIKKPNSTYESLKEDVKNLADLGINVKRGSQRAVLAAVINLWRQIIDKNSGRYWTFPRCEVTDTITGTGTVTEATCSNHFQLENGDKGNTYKPQIDTITFDDVNCEGCCLVYDSAREVLRNQKCDSVEEISGYIVQYPKYARVNDSIGVSYCYDGFTWTKVQEFNTQLHYNQATKYCPHQKQRCDPLLKIYESPTFLL